MGNGTAETGYLAAVRESYDTVAADYVRPVSAQLEMLPPPTAPGGRPQTCLLARKAALP